ncbi:multiple C2 and transmembrane domain-containing protein 2 isoform X2 [Channa argus]|uniref:multiple C2 and transmembrane domain-containing protein 2 isoform X2 n=1 Tax=Channa argus TaxID=215402 RepID=UPI0035226DF9
MDVKKKNFLENLRLKTKFGIMKKPGKKALAKQGKKLAHRRSISVPDLRLVPGEAFSAENAFKSGASVSPGVSDTDSVASGSVTEIPLFTDKLNDSVLQTTMKLCDEVDNAVNSSSENNVSLNEESLYSQVNKRAKGNAQRFSFDPVPALRGGFTNTQVLSPRPNLETGSLSGEKGGSSEDTPADRARSGTLAAALVRAQSMNKELPSPSIEKRNMSSDRGTPPTTRQTAYRTPVTSDSLAAPLENADGTSMDSEDSEEPEQEIFSPFVRRGFFIEDVLLEYGEPEETQEETAEVSSETCDLFDENVQDPFENSVMMGGPETQVAGPFQRYLLSIVLKRGKNLVIRDKRSGTSDPYVKFKLEGKQFYKSKVVYKSLNPRWNESFSHPLRDREHMVEVRVYDKNRTADEFMGSSTIDMKDLELYKTYEMELPLDDPKSKEDDMGVIIVDVCLMFRDATIKRSPRWPAKKNKNQVAPSQQPAETQKNQLTSQMWCGVLSITLVEGQDLPQYGHGDIYVRFRLGEQKYRSKNLCIQANPQWREQFDFNQFEDNQEPLQVEVCSKRGRKGEESWGMFEIDLSRLPLNERQLYTHVLDPGKGRLVFLVTLRPCWGVSISDIETAPLEKPDERHSIEEKFSLKNSHKCVGEVGFLQVKIIKANDLTTDLNGKSNPFCVIELGNSKLQTHTIYKTLNPEWNKAFTFPIKDINDVIELSILDENGDKAGNLMGKVAIPLLSVQNGQQICLFLKKENLGSASKGTITLVLEVIYNKVRAGIKSFQPKETKLVEENLKFSKKVLAQNIYRVRKISTAVLYTLQYIKSCFQWESTQRSLIAFLIFLVTVWHWELFMLPLFLLLLIGWNYFQLAAGKAVANQDLVNISMGDDEEEDEKEAGKKGLMDKIHMVQEVVLAVQNILEEIANIGERAKNIFNWSVPFLSFLACLVLFVSAALLYLIPLRYIVLIWGVNKFTKKLRNPYTIDSNEILDFLKRVPSDVQKVQYSALRAPTSQSQPRKKR